MGQVLYEVSSFDYREFFSEFGEMYLVFAVGIISLIMLPSLAQRVANKSCYKYKEGGLRIQNVKLFFAIFSILGILFLGSEMLSDILRQIDMYDKVVKAYQLGNYEVVEGYVENFGPSPNHGGSNKSESFDINGVSFYYTTYQRTQGYHNPKSYGGIIIGDGQHLRIRYIYYDKIFGNIIVYIEELD